MNTQADFIKSNRYSINQMTPMKCQYAASIAVIVFRRNSTDSSHGFHTRHNK